MMTVKWTVVQHSAMGYVGNSVFAKGLEPRILETSDDTATVIKARGKLFDSYKEAYDFCFKEMYEKTEGITPQAPGRFSQDKVDGLRIYVPKS